MPRDAAAAHVNARERLIGAAIAAGKFPESRRAHYAAMYDRDPLGTERLVAMMAGTELASPPPGARGGRSRPGAPAPTGGPAYPPEWFPEVGARRAEGPHPRIVHAHDAGEL